MSKQTALVWYASYGSNLSESRFLCYIKGGQASGSKKINTGCTDKSLPRDQKKITLHHELYFANESTSWNHSGVCFINPKQDKNILTLGRMFLQFCELIQQENQFTDIPEIDFNRAIQHGSLLLDEKSWYGNLLHLGEENGYPIFTFTNSEYLEQNINPPSQEYLSTIINGLKETHKTSPEELKNYFKDLKGIKNTLMEGELDYLAE